MDLILYGMLLLLAIEQVVNVPYQRRRKLQPKFLPTPTNITVHRGETATLKCHIRDLGPKKVVWRKRNEDNPLTIGDEMFSQEDHMAIEANKLSEDETQFDLIIKDIQSPHAGTYLCQVIATKLYTHYITLTVLDEPVKPTKEKDRIHLTGSEFVNQDSPISLLCNVSGQTRAPDHIDWFFNGNRIVTSEPQWKDRTEILRRTEGKMYISELVVERSTADDQGTYVCRGSGGGMGLPASSINVNVLNAKIPPPIRVIRDPESIVDTNSSPSSVVFQNKSTCFQTLTFALCLTYFFNSNKLFKSTVNDVIFFLTVLVCVHYTHR